MIKNIESRLFIIKRIKYYENKLKETENSKKKILIEEAICSLKKFYNDYYGRYVQEPNISMKKIEMDDKGTLSIYRDFLPFIYKVYEEVYAKKSTQNSLPELQYVNSDKSKILSVTKDFYNNIGNIFAEKLNYLYESDNIHIYFYKSSDYDTTSAVTFKVKNFKEIFIRFGLQNSLEDYLVSIHEHSHAISSLINSKHIESDFKKCLSEVDSYFFELVGLEYLKNNGFDKAEINKSLHTFLEFIENCFKFIIGKDTLYKEGSINKVYSLEEIINMYIEKFGYTEDEAYNMAIAELRGYIAYSTSALVAVELYHQYKINPNVAIENLKKIIMLEKYNFNEYIKEVEKKKIIRGEHYKNFYEMVCSDEKRKYNNELKKQL